MTSHNFQILKIKIFSAYCILRKMRKLCIGCINAQYIRKICTRFYFFLQCTIYAQDLRKIVLISSMRNICARFAQDCTYFSNVQYMRKICARLYLFVQCAIYAQDLHKIILISPIRKICARLNLFPQCTRLYLFVQCPIYAQDWRKIVLISSMRKIVLLSPMRNICARFAQNCTSFPNAQYMHKICPRLYLFVQCAIYAQDWCKIVLISSMCKIVLLSPMRNICTRFAQDCTYFLNAQYMHKICTRLYFFLQCAIYA